MPAEMQALVPGLHATDNALTHEFISTPRPPAESIAGEAGVPAGVAVPPLTEAELEDAISHLETFGYCVLDARVPEAFASGLAEACLELHGREENAHRMHGAGEEYQTLFGMLNEDERVWECAAHPDVQTVVTHFLGSSYRAVRPCLCLVFPLLFSSLLFPDSSLPFHCL